MKSRKLTVIVFIYLVFTLAGCGGKFMKTQSEDLAPFADQTISLVAEIGTGIEKAQTIAVGEFIDINDPDVSQYIRLREEINEVFRAIVLYSIDIVTIAESGRSGQEKAAALANYLEAVEEPIDTETDVKLRLTKTEMKGIMDSIRAQDSLYDGLVAAQPLINEVARYGDAILERMRLALLNVDKKLGAAIDDRFRYLTTLGSSLEEKIYLLTEAEGYIVAYKKGDRRALDKLRQMEVMGLKGMIPPGKLTWKQIDELDQFILSRIVSIQQIMKEHDFSLKVYLDTRQELNDIVVNRLARIASGRLFLFTWARAHQKMASGKMKPAEWFDITEAPQKLLQVGVKALF